MNRICLHIPHLPKPTRLELSTHLNKLETDRSFYHNTKYKYYHHMCIIIPHFVQQMSAIVIAKKYVLIKMYFLDDSIVQMFQTFE